MSTKRNPYGSKSQRGTEVAARFSSLLETARLRGEDRATTYGALRSPPAVARAPSRSRRARADLCSGLALRPGRLSTGTGHGEHLLALRARWG